MPVKYRSRPDSSSPQLGGGAADRLGADGAVRKEGEEAQPAVRGDILVLAADGLAAGAELDRAGLPRQRLGVHLGPAVRVPRR